MQQESDLSLEVAILLVLGILTLVLGIRMFSVDGWPPQSAYGLFIMIASIQALTLGKTPFGDMHRSWALVLFSLAIAVLGMYIAWTPGHADFARQFVGAVLLFGGGARLIQLYLDKTAARTWFAVGGVLTELAVACTLVYTLTLILGASTLFAVPGPISISFLLLLGGVSLFYLACCLERVDELYPRKSSIEKESGGLGLFREMTLSRAQAFSFLMGAFFIGLGVLLALVSFGFVPFSPDGQYGTVLVIVAIQLMSLREPGKTGSSGATLIIGTAFAGLGAFSATFPGALTGVLAILFCALNAISGVTALSTGLRSRAGESATTAEAKRMTLIQTATGLLMMLLVLTFLTTAIFPTQFGGLLPSLAVAAILVVVGLLNLMQTRLRGGLAPS
jgi:hypothetical protein